MGGEKKTIRILSPITSFKEAVRVISAGADEIYCGVMIPNVEYMGLSTRHPLCSLSTYDELGRVVNYAHDHGVKVIVTTEFPFMAEVIEREIKNHISSSVDKGVDAIIASDIGIVLAVKDMGLDIPVYASTYLASMNYEAVDFLRKLGVERVILERHLTIDEIREIAERSKGIEIEAFIHGAGCSNINVNCYGCTPSADIDTYLRFFVEAPEVPFAFTLCTIPYDIYKVDNDTEMKLNCTNILDAYTFCSLCRLPDLVQTGITCLKIIGRGAPPPYSEETTRIYRELLDIIELGQIDLFEEKLKSLKSIKYSTETLSLTACKQKRCYYSPFFHAPYKIDPLRS